MAAVIGIDVGGTTIKGERLDLAGGAVLRSSVATPAGADAVVSAVTGLIAELRDAGDPLGVGIVVPGAVDADAGIARWSANLGWRDLPLRDIVADRIGLAVVLDHDVRAAGIAEAALGHTAGIAHSLVVTVGTGVAGAVVVHGRPVTGTGGLAGEIGHLVVQPGGEACPCGQLGCLERYASAAAIARRYRERSGRTAGTEEIAGSLSIDGHAAAVWQEAVEALATGLAAYTMLMDPEIIVVAGGLAGAGAALLDPVRAAVSARMTWRPCPRIEPSDLGARAGVLGAAVLAARAVGVDAPAAWAAPSADRGE